MNYNDTVKIYIDVIEKDSMGGCTTEKVLVNTIKGKVIPFRVEPEIYADGKINSNKAKLFTRDNINVGMYDDFYIEYDGQMYIKVQYIDYKKIKYVLMERVK